MSKYYITTAIDYVNGKPHIGHAYEKVAADVLARFYSARLGRDQVFFLTGTDEHGAKIAQYAKEAGRGEQEYVDETSSFFKFAWDQLNVVPNRFIRTTDQDHETVVAKIVEQIKASGYLYEGDYEGLYCVGHEAFLTEKDLVGGLCPEHQTKPEIVKEKNWFLKLSAFTDEIAAKVKSGELRVWPEKAKNEVLSWLEQGFHDIAVTRPNVDWGVKVPWDQGQTVYVWVDALINYISGVGYGQKEFTKWWPADAHVIGPDIAKFHCIIWPALLLAAGLPLPKCVVVHGFFTLSGKKISKSLGNVVDPNDWVAKYGSDAVRYFLLREVPFGEDGDVSEEKLRARYEGELANGWGNLVSRVTTLVEKYLEGNLVFTPFGEDNDESRAIDKLVEEFRFHEALSKIWEWVAWSNKTVDEQKLWELGKTDLAKFAETSKQLLAAIHAVATKLLPFMPESSTKILKHLASGRITKIEPLFPKVD